MTTTYQILPFYFENINNKILISTDHGDYIWLTIDEFNQLLSYNINTQSELFYALESKQIITNNLECAIEKSAIKLRTRKRFLFEATSLHMLVITVRCNQRCEYCQVSCKEDNAYEYDMSIDTAKKIVDVILESPADCIKIEFQGGEPTLNFSVIEAVILYVKEKNTKKNISFVICTNLTAITEKQIHFLNTHHVEISTSLDGTKEIHNTGRILRCGNDTHNMFLNNLYKTREIMGRNAVDALMTTTKTSLSKPKEIIDEYISHGFHGIFLRALNPYGFAREQADKIGYTQNEFIDFYKECLDYIIHINKKGIYFIEYYTALLFSRIMTSQSTGFVDLQSPSGAVISAVIYDYDGTVYPADEARMLARMGDKKFALGNVYQNSYNEIFCNATTKEIIQNSWLDIIPLCSDCVFKPYCGGDPIRNYLEFGDTIGNQSMSDFCTKNKNIFKHLFTLLEYKENAEIFWSWIQR